MRYLLPRGMMDTYVHSYLGTEAEQRAERLNDWRVAPLKAQSLAGLPPMVVVSCGLDPLCDEALELVRRVRQEQGQESGAAEPTHVHMPGAIHGFLTLPSFATDRKQCEFALSRIEAAVKRGPDIL